MSVDIDHGPETQGSVTRRVAILGAAALPLAGNQNDPDAGLLAACRRHLAAYNVVRSLSWPRDGDAVFQAARHWHDVYFREVAPVVPATAAGAEAKLQAQILFDGPPRQALA